MNRLLQLAFFAATLACAQGAWAQPITRVIGDGNYSVLGGTTVTVSAELPEGWEPVNDQVAFVYDPEFHFFMRGYMNDPTYDRRAAFRNVGYVVVAAAGDPGGYYRPTPTWITHEGFEASFAEGQVDVRYAYGATYVPTRRGFQSFVIYTNLREASGDASLWVYDDALGFGGGNYLITGDGPEQAVSLQLSSDGAAFGSRAIEVRTHYDAPGSHWKLMLFANGHAAGFDGIDLSGYDRLVFYARASRDVVLQGGFGTADDSGALSFGALQVTTEYQRFELDLSSVDRTDVNTPFWVFLHKALNPIDYTDLSVWFDAIQLVPAR